MATNSNVTFCSKDVMRAFYLHSAWVCDDAVLAFTDLVGLKGGIGRLHQLSG